ncbi:MAG: MFS transporter [Anaerolineae bacterium]
MTSRVRRNIPLLAWFNFLLDFRLYAPIMVIYFERITDSYALAMSVLSVIMLSAALLEVPTGIFSDMIGRRRTVIVGAVASLGAVTCYAIGGTYWVLLMGAFLEGLERALFSGNNDALLHDTLAELDQRGDYQVQLGRVSSAYQFALAISAVAGGVIAAVSFGAVMWLSVLPKVMMVALSLRFIEPAVHSAASGNVFGHLKEALRQFAINPRLRLLSIAQIIMFGAGETAFQFRPVFIESLWPLWAIGVARAVSNMTAAFSFFFAGDLLKRFGERPLIYGGNALSEFINTVALIWPTVLSPLLMGSTSIFYGVNTVSQNGLMQREFTDAQRATMGSLTAFGGSLFFAVFSLLLGWLADVMGVRNALIIATLFGTTRLIFYWLAFRRDPAPQPAT